MKNLFNLMFILLLGNFNSQAQDGFIAYKPVRVNQIPSIEKTFNSKAFDSEYDVVVAQKGAMVNYGKAKIYRRPRNDPFGPVNVRYGYSKKDSIVKLIDYNWIIGNGGSSKQALGNYNIAFDTIVNDISALFGNPLLNQGELKKIAGDGFGERYERRVSWQYKDAEIITIMIWTAENGQYINTSVKWQ